MGTKVCYLVHGPMWVLLPPRGNFLDNNILILLGLWVRKMHVGTRIKVALGDYCLLYQLCQTGKIEVEI